MSYYRSPKLAGARDLPARRPGGRLIDIPNELVIAARRGDQDACRELVETLHRPIIATIYRFLGQGFRKDVEDVSRLWKVWEPLERIKAATGDGKTRSIRSIWKDLRKPYEERLNEVGLVL